MTQTYEQSRNFQSIVKAPVGAPPQTRQVVAWDKLCEFARLLLDLERQHRPLTMFQTQAVSRLDTLLMSLRHDGEIKDFQLGEFDSEGLEVFITVPDARYFRRFLLPLRERLRDMVDDLNISLNIHIRTDLTCDEHSPAR